MNLYITKLHLLQTLTVGRLKTVGWIQDKRSIYFCHQIRNYLYLAPVERNFECKTKKNTILKQNFSAYQNINLNYFGLNKKLVGLFATTFIYITVIFLKKYLLIC